ncbi:MAG: DNA topoisomerase, partial [Prevotella sp.]
MIPQRFGIKLIDDKGIKHQFEVIERLMQAADGIINCGDAGQEGELIQRWVMQKAKATCPVKRLWISSMTDEAIREGFRTLKAQEDYQSLYLAGLSRAIGDWLLGMNATRLYTLKYGQNRQVLSVGRVQTPTLALIVNRQKEIEEFKPEPYWILSTVYRDTTFTATKGKFTSKEEGERSFETIAGKPFTVTDVQKKNGTEAPPHLYDLTSLQVDCNSKFAMSAEMTLNIIQSLYEKKLTTYPRVDTQYLSDDIYPKCQATLAGLKGYGQLTQPLAGKPLKKSKKVFDSSKVTDHHAIIPTGVPANNLSDMERNVYDLVTRRFISAFYPDCKFATTTVLGMVDDVEFKVTGKTILDAGWRRVYASDRPEETVEETKREDEERTLPPFTKGESGPHEPCLTEKWTTPPKYYTEATLLRAMETAGKFVDDEQLRAALKENGIGRPSSRAAIIETLFKRHYIKRERKNLIATPTGIELIGMERREFLLRDALRQVDARYDLIFIDCPPSLELLTLNALCAADSILVPVQCEYYALEGLSDLMTTLRAVKRGLNPSLSIFGVLLTMYDGRTNFSAQVAEEVRRHFPGKVFASVIPRNVRLSEAPSHGLPVRAY